MGVIRTLGVPDDANRQPSPAVVPAAELCALELLQEGAASKYGGLAVTPPAAVRLSTMTVSAVAELASRHGNMKLQIRRALKAVWIISMAWETFRFGNNASF